MADDYSDYDFGGGGVDPGSPEDIDFQNWWAQQNQPSGDYISPGDLPSGGGVYSIGGGDWNSIYAPGEQAPQYEYTPSGYVPASSPRSSNYSPSSLSPDFSFDLNRGSGVGGNYGSPGARSVASMQPNLISLGKPEDDLYKRYKSLLMNPDFSGDPTYQFLYNQGLQALNRNLAAKRMTLSGKSMNDTLSYGSGMASKYMQDLFPQYQAGAREELNRFMGPAGLLPHYASSNNSAIGMSDRMVGNAQDRAMYGQPLDLGNLPMGENFSGAGIGYGGVGGSSNPATYSTANSSFTPRPLSFQNSGGLPPGYDISSLMDEMT